MTMFWKKNQIGKQIFSINLTIDECLIFHSVFY